MQLTTLGSRFADDISAALEEQWDDVPRRSLEAIAVEAYRTGALTLPGARLLGGQSRFQVHALLREHHVPLQYTAADLEDDLQAQRELGILPADHRCGRQRAAALSKPAGTHGTSFAGAERSR